RVPARLERLVQDAATKLSPSEHGGRSLAPDARPVAAERAEAEARRGVVHEGNPAERQVDIRLLEVCAQRGTVQHRGHGVVSEGDVVQIGQPVDVLGTQWPDLDAQALGCAFW